jgi:hydroxylaminobenzene mutase
MVQGDKETVVSRRLLQAGVALFLLGLVTGAALPILENPRMGLASHLEGILNGMFLVCLGLLWSRLALSGGQQTLLLGTAIFGTFANWLATLLAAWWGAGSMMSIAAAGYQGSAWQEMFISSLLIVLSLAMMLVCAMLLYGLRTPRVTT